MIQPGYIFIGGSSKTGTSLLRYVLNDSKDVAICNETHFFENPKTIVSLLQYILNSSAEAEINGAPKFLEKLVKPGFRQKFAKIGDISTDAGAKKIVDYIYNMRPNFFWDWLQENVEREEFLGRLLESNRTEQSFFNLLMAFYACGKPIWGEKTPVNIYHVPTLLRWFPNAKFIHTFRDPRGVFVVTKHHTLQKDTLAGRTRLFRNSKLTFEMYIGLNVIIKWLYIVQLHDQYQQLYPNNYYFSRYEDLIRDPKTHLKKLCNFLEIDLTEGMLERIYRNSDRITLQEDRLKDLHPVINRWFVLLCRRHLLQFGYQL
jgi:hypothetical protein